MAKFKFDIKKFEKNLSKELEKVLKNKQKELVIRNRVMRRE